MTISEPRQLTLIIGHLPYSELSANARLHWAEKRKWTKAAREEIGWIAKPIWHDDKPMELAEIAYRFYTKDHRRRDIENLIAACKPWTDGLCDAKVIRYDDAAHLSLGLCSLTTDTENKTVVELKEVLARDEVKA